MSSIYTNIRDLQSNKYSLKSRVSGLLMKIRTIQEIYETKISVYKEQKNTSDTAVIAEYAAFNEVLTSITNNITTLLDSNSKVADSLFEIIETLDIEKICINEVKEVLYETR